MPQKDENNFPRRFRLDLNTPAELAIYNAMQEVEKMPYDPRLTEVVQGLAKIKDVVADIIEKRNPLTELELAIEFLKSRAHSTEKIKSLQKFVSVQQASEVTAILEMVKENKFKDFYAKLHKAYPEAYPLEQGPLS